MFYYLQSCHRPMRYFLTKLLLCEITKINYLTVYQHLLFEYQHLFVLQKSTEKVSSDILMKFSNVTPYTIVA